jgi:hypothetical protein
MTSPKNVISAFLRRAGEPRDTEGTPFKEDRISLSKDKALIFLKKLYPWVRITVEAMPGGLAYYGEFSPGRRMIGNYSFEREELWYKIYPGTKVPRKNLL